MSLIDLVPKHPVVARLVRGDDLHQRVVDDAVLDSRDAYIVRIPLGKRSFNVSPFGLHFESISKSRIDSRRCDVPIYVCDVRNSLRKASC